MEYVLITPPGKVPEKTFLSHLFLNLPTDIAGNCSTKLNTQTISNDRFTMDFLS